MSQSAVGNAEIASSTTVAVPEARLQALVDLTGALPKMKKSEMGRESALVFHLAGWVDSSDAAMDRDQISSHPTRYPSAVKSPLILINI
jgi:hypothetical protein